MRYSYWLLLAVFLPSVLLSQPKLTLSRTAIDLGDIFSTMTPQVTVKIQNTGTEPLIIKSVDAGCSCVTTYIPQKPIQPNGFDSISMVVDASKLDGKFKRIAAVETNIAGASAQYIEIQGNVIQSVGAPLMVKNEQVSEEVRKLETIVQSVNNRISSRTLPQNDEETKQMLIERKKSMVELAKRDPVRFLILSISNSELSSIPKELQELVETQKSITGTLIVIIHDDFAKNTSRTEYVLQDDNGERYNLNLVGLFPRLKSNQRLTINGVGIQNELVADNSGVHIQSVREGVGPIQRTTGEQNVVAFMINYPDSKYTWPYKFNQDFLRKKLDTINIPPSWWNYPPEYSPFNSPGAFMKEQSYGKVSFKVDAFGPFTMNDSAHFYNHQFILPTLYDIKPFIDSLGINMSQYNRIMIFVNHQDFSGGVSSVGMVENIVGNQKYNASVSWIGSIVEFDSSRPAFIEPSIWGTQPFLYGWVNIDFLICHEMGGHGFGLYHSGGMFCEHGVINYGNKCNNNNQDTYINTGFWRYGNVYDVMGTWSFTLHTNSYNKEFLGWIEPQNILKINKPGIYKINPLELKDGVVAAKILPQNADTNSKGLAYVEIRRPIGYDLQMDSSFRNKFSLKDNLKGVFLIQPNNNDKTDINDPASFLIDMSPEDTTLYNNMQKVTLNVGKTYQDKIQGFTLNVLSIDSLSATVGVDYNQNSPNWDLKPQFIQRLPSNTNYLPRYRNNIIEFVFRYKSLPNSNHSPTQIRIKPYLDDQWKLEQNIIDNPIWILNKNGKYFPVGKHVQLSDGDFILQNNDSVDIVTTIRIPKTWSNMIDGYRFYPSMKISLQNYDFEYDSIPMFYFVHLNGTKDPAYFAIGSNSSCITKKMQIKKVEKLPETFHVDGNGVWSLNSINNDLDSIPTLLLNQNTVPIYNNSKTIWVRSELYNNFYSNCPTEAIIDSSVYPDGWVVNNYLRYDNYVAVHYKDSLTERDTVKYQFQSSRLLSENVPFYSSVGGTFSIYHEIKPTSNIDGKIILKYAKDALPNMDTTATYTIHFVPTIIIKDTSILFGNVKKSTLKVIKIPIANTGAGRLLIDSIYTDNNSFVIDSTKYILEVSDTIWLSVTFRPESFREYHNTLYIKNNSQTPLIKISLSGTSLYPDLTVNKNNIIYSSTNQHMKKKDSLMITNTSLNVLQIDSIWTKTKYFIIAENVSIYTLKQNDTSKIILYFEPDTASDYRDTLYILNNSKSPLITIPLLGTGVLEVNRISDQLPNEYSLGQNYPNPFNPVTTIRYGLPSSSTVSLKIYNVLGQQIADLVNSEQSAGWYETTWSANVSSGLYFYRIDAVSSAEPQKRFTQLKKMILLK